MAFIPLPKIYSPGFSNPRIKPSPAVELDDSHPLYQYVVSANYFINQLLPPHDLARNKSQSIEGSPSIGVGPTGNFVSLPSTGDSIVVGRGGKLDNLKASTYIVKHRLLSSGGGGGSLQHMIDKAGNDTSGVRWRLDVGSQQFRRDFSSGDLSVYTDDVGISVGDINTFAVTWDGTSSNSGVRHYKNGVELLGRTINNSGTGTQVNDSGNDFRISGRLDGTRSADADMFFALIFNVELSADWIRSITDNPYQLLKPATPPVYFTAASVAPSVSIPVIMHSYKQRRV